MIIISIRINGFYLGNDKTIVTLWKVINYFFLAFLDLSFLLKFIQKLVSKQQNDNT